MNFNVTKGKKEKLELGGSFSGEPLQDNEKMINKRINKAALKKSIQYFVKLGRGHKLRFSSSTGPQQPSGWNHLQE